MNRTLQEYDMLSRYRGFSKFVGLVSALAATAGSLLLSGCTLATTASGPSSYAMPAMKGKVMGGETPILGANVILWQTTSGGYGATAIQLASTTTGPGGTFSITPGSYTCAAGQYAYITSTGGDVSNGGGVINNQDVLLAALGSCSNFGSATAEANINIVLNEVSTVAAAYALRSFISVTPSSSGNQLVNIGAPANNNAATGSCTGAGPGKVAPGMTCVAAGLGHAFANAMMLTDSVHFDGSNPTGLALTTLVGNSSATVPQTVIHTLANILQSCTNSSSGSGLVGSIQVTASGSGYTVPTVTITDAAMIGSGATGSLTVNSATGAITSFAITSGGSGYASPVFTINGIGSGAVLAATNTGGILSTGTVLAGGTGYSTTTVTLSGVGSGATASANINAAGGVASITVNSGGSGYTSAPTVTISDPVGSGATATASTSSSTCNSLFTITGPYTGNATDTLSATMGIASAINKIGVASIFGLAPGAGAAFQPALAAAPTNFQLWVIYAGVSVGGTTTAMSAPQSLALDADDNVYILNTNQIASPSPPATVTNYASGVAAADSTSLATTAGVVAMTDNGQGLWANPLSSSYCYSGIVAVDPFSNVWVASGPSTALSTGTGCFPNVTPLQTASGAVNTAISALYPATSVNGSDGGANDTVHKLAASVQTIIFDNYGDMILGNRLATTSGEYYIYYNKGTGTLPSYGGATNGYDLSTQIANPWMPITDNNDNLYLNSDTSNTKTLNIKYNTNSATVGGAPSLPSTNATFSLGNAISGLEFLDANNNIYFTYQTAVYALPAGSTIGTPSTAATTGTLSGNLTAEGAIDGNGNVFYISRTSTNGMFAVASVNSSAMTVSAVSTNTPCYVPGGATSCATSGNMIEFVGAPKIDSAGAVWYPMPTAIGTGTSPYALTGAVAQMIGAGAPAWPLQAYGVFGVKPQ